MTSESMYPVLVIGHHHPDTDAICSALAYANFYHWQTGRDTVPCYLDQLQLPQEFDLPIGVLQRSLEAELLVGSADAVLNDRVWIATMIAETARTTIHARDVVIVGDQPEVQQAALAAGAGCLIVT